jgi:hypothetical protein
MRLKLSAQLAFTAVFTTQNARESGQGPDQSGGKLSTLRSLSGAVVLRLSGRVEADSMAFMENFALP